MSEEFQLMMNNRGEGNGAADVPPSQAARSVSPDDLVESLSYDEEGGDLDQFGIGPTDGAAAVITGVGSATSSSSLAPRRGLDAGIASKFTIRACSGPSCVLLSSSSSEQDRDPGALNAYKAFVRLAQDRAPTVHIEESSVCLVGSSSKGNNNKNGGGDGCPSNGGCCVEVRHEQSSKVRRYVNLKTASDVEKVWSCVEAAIRAMEIKQGTAGGG